MYSFSPIFDDTAYHYGFYIGAVFFGIIILLLIVEMIQEKEHYLVGVGVILFCSAIITIIHHNSYHGKPPVNEQIVGEFVGYTSEGWNELSGRTRQDRHYLYVTYKVPEGLIVLNASAGYIYPKYVILYKN